MKINDIVNIKSVRTYWKGIITEIYDNFDGIIKYTEPIAHVKGDGIKKAVVMESNLIYKNNEWWEIK